MGGGSEIEQVEPMSELMDKRNSPQPNITVPDFPNVVNVEVYRGNCPCRCVHCPVGTAPPAQRKQIFGAGEISLSLFRKIAEEISTHSTPVLRIHSTGEPLLWQKLPNAMDILKKTRTKSWLFTSAVTTDKSLLAAICEAVRIIEVSVNSISAEDYRSTKGIDAFALVMENIRYMRGVIGQEKSRRLIVSRVESGRGDVDNEFVSYWKSSNLVDDAFIRSRHTYNGLLPELMQGPPLVAKKEPCLVHWARFNIGLGGQAIVCFNELFKNNIDRSLILGDVNIELIAEIWKGAKLAALRRAELTGDYSELTYEDVLPCKNCTSCQPLFGSERKTSEYQLGQVE